MNPTPRRAGDISMPTSAFARIGRCTEACDGSALRNPSTPLYTAPTPMPTKTFFALAPPVSAAMRT